MAAILAIDQDYDLVTEYSQAFRESLVFSLLPQQFPHHRLYLARNDHATRAYIDSVLTSKSISFITGAGHGLRHTFTGHNGQVVWDASEDLSYLAGKIVHLLSCQTGSSLGQKMVADGVVAFWGYAIDFQFLFTHPQPSPLDTDDEARVFFQMDLVVLKGILKRLTAQEIRDSVQVYYTKMYPQLRPGQKALLLSNLTNLIGPSVGFGDEHAVLP